MILVVTVPAEIELVDQFMIRTIHRAKYVLAEADLLLQDSAVHISELGRITSVEPGNSSPSSPEVELVDWGSAVIMPGLVNAHTHLELTRLHRQLTQFSSFTDWISQLIQERREWSPEDFLESTRQGARLSVSAGTTLVGDTSASGASWKALKSQRLRKLVFEETLSLMPEKASEKLAALKNQLEKIETDELLSAGVSPHAPYSVSTELYRGISDWVRHKGLLLSTHVAETKSEVEFLRYGTGEFREFLASIGALPEGWQPRGLTPVSYLEKIGIMDTPNLLIHCNYVDDQEMAAILRSRSSVVYCPRSHAFFGHEEHPVRQFLDLGVNVALGTDSLASNDTLSLLDEMRFLFEKRKDLKSDEIFRMATLNGASALGFGSVLGRLRRGRWADMTILKLPEDLSSRNLTSQILAGTGECMATVIQGEIAWRRQ